MDTDEIPTTLPPSDSDETRSPTPPVTPKARTPATRDERILVRARRKKKQAIMCLIELHRSNQAIRPLVAT